MAEQGRNPISFPMLDYMRPGQRSTSLAKIVHRRADLYSVGDYLTSRSSGNQIREILREYKVSMSGRKEQLMEKLARLSVHLYEERRQELDTYFGEHRFIRIASERQVHKKPFPLLKNSCLGNMVLAMYILRHLRGNAVLEAAYENDTFDLIDLARSLIHREVSLEGSLMTVE